MRWPLCRFWQITVPAAGLSATLAACAPAFTATRDALAGVLDQGGAPAGRTRPFLIV
ncbi:hypothetical protein P7L78_26845 [Tistrella bauzanensis]|jgi:hypothetical protein|uniref:Uncharacterized protein n=1 Tax=Tistrella arctica TaxID=3133430 RepID=A0ABU9YGZ9_9PROT